MKIKEGFRMRVLGRDHIVVAEGLNLVDFNKMVVLNPTAAYLWEAVCDKEFDAQTLRDLLLAKYDVGEQQAAEDAGALIDKWNEAGLLE